MKKAAIALGLVLVLPGMAACGGAEDPPAEPAVESTTQPQAEGDGTGAAADETEGSTVDEGLPLPSTWPEAVPVPPDMTLTSTSGDLPTGLWTGEQSAEEAITAYGQELELSGFTMTGESEADESLPGALPGRTYQGNGYGVDVIAYFSNGESYLDVTVTETAS